MPLFTVLDVEKAMEYSSSDNLNATLGGTVGACVVLIIGVIMVVFVIRYIAEF